MAKRKVTKPIRANAVKRMSAKARLKSARVGKGYPPVHTRFGKGRSGNPRGRPKGSKNLATIIMDAAMSPVFATIDGEPRKISMVAASVMQLATKAASGDPKYVREFLDRVEEIENRAAAARPAQFPFGPEDLEVLKVIHARMVPIKPKRRN
jgi:hypothetical protein